MPRVPSRRRSQTQSTAAAQLNHGLAGTVTTVSPELAQMLERHLRARQAGAVVHGPHRKTQRSPPGHIKRPENSFMKFRTALYECEQITGGAQQDLSRRAGVLWHSLPKHSSIRRLCHDMAQADARKHREEHPGYKYTPLRLPKTAAAAAAASKRVARKRAVTVDDDADYEDCVTPVRRTLRKQTKRRVYADEDDEDEAATAASESDAGSVSSGATAVGASSDSERESSLTAQSSPAPTAASPAAHEYGTETCKPQADAVSSPCTPVFTLEGSCTPRPGRATATRVKTEQGKSPLLPSVDPASLLDYSFWLSPLIGNCEPSGNDFKLEDDSTFNNSQTLAASCSSRPYDLGAGPWDLTREDFLSTSFNAPSSPSTEMQVDSPPPADGLTVDMMMEQYINWGTD